MNANELANAIKYLHPKSEFVFQGEDYSTIEWHKLDGDAPTLEEIEQAHQAIKTAATQAEEQAAAKKAVAEAKLAALGLTSDDLKALGLG